jgi:hypothetical protein
MVVSAYVAFKICSTAPAKRFHSARSAASRFLPAAVSV